MGQRWYDNDPALSRALDHLRNSSDIYQAQVALNIIKIVIEHHIESNSSVEVDTGEGLSGNLHIVTSAAGNPGENNGRRRWYDVNETLRSAMQLLRDCPEDLQQKIIPTITRMIEQTLEEPFPL